MAREVEVKLLMGQLRYDQVLSLLHAATLSELSFMKRRAIIDCYWPCDPNVSKAEFLRLRVSDDVELTTKVNDKGTIRDRIEHNCIIDGSDKDGALAVLHTALGEPAKLLYRCTDFQVKDADISVIENLEKPEWCFVEIESAMPEVIDYWRKRIEKQVDENYSETIDVVKNSFYDIFVKRVGVLV
jgi:hypothetical protein